MVLKMIGQKRVSPPKTKGTKKELHIACPRFCLGSNILRPKKSPSKWQQRSCNPLRVKDLINRFVSAVNCFNIHSSFCRIHESYLLLDSGIHRHTKTRTTTSKNWSDMTRRSPKIPSFVSMFLSQWRGRYKVYFVSCCISFLIYIQFSHMVIPNNDNNEIIPMHPPVEKTKVLLSRCHPPFSYSSLPEDGGDEDGDVRLNTTRGKLSENIEDKEDLSDSYYLLPSDGPDQNVSFQIRQQLPHQDFEDIFSSCSATSQVRLIPNCPHWEIQTLDSEGNEKSVGGDEFYVTYTDAAHFSDTRQQTESSPSVKLTKSNSRTNRIPSNQQRLRKLQQEGGDHHPTAIAEIVDLKDGRYRLEFVSSPLNHRIRDLHRLAGHGFITIYTQYTCGIGNMFPPTKENWTASGSNVVQWSSMVDHGPPVIKFEPPPRSVDLSACPTLVVFGDSVMGHFVEPLDIKIPNVGRPLATDTVNDWIHMLNHRHKPRLQQHQRTATGLENGDRIGTTSDDVPVLLVSSHTWDLLQPSVRNGFDDHGAAIHMFLDRVNQLYPHVKVIWKSPTALHIHVPMLRVQRGETTELYKSYDRYGKFLERLKYMSASRSYQLYLFQRQIMKDRGIPFLDVYQASYLSADHTQIGDGRHYMPNLNSLTVNWFVSESMVEVIWKTYFRDRQKRVTVEADERTTEGKMDMDDEDGTTSMVSRSTSNRQNRPRKVLLMKQCNSLVDIANAGLIAALTNRQLIFLEMSTPIASTENIRSIPNADEGKSDCGRYPIERKFFLLVYDSGNHDNDSSRNDYHRYEEDVDQKYFFESTSDIVVMPQVFQGSPITEEKLQLYGISELSHLQRLAKELFSHGEDFLYGMILTDLLLWPIVDIDVNQESIQEEEEERSDSSRLPSNKFRDVVSGMPSIPENSVILVVLDDNNDDFTDKVRTNRTESSDDGKKKLRRRNGAFFTCQRFILSKIANQKESIPCHVLTHSAERADWWNENILHGQNNNGSLNCTAVTIPQVRRQGSYDGRNSDDTERTKRSDRDVAEPFCFSRSFLEEVGNFSPDGYVIVSSTARNSRAYKSLLSYFLERHARISGTFAMELYNEKDSNDKNKDKGKNKIMDAPVCTAMGYPR